MKIKSSVISHPGKCRGKNEDNFCFDGVTLCSESLKKPLKLCKRTKNAILMGVFDGMGGISAGEVASKITSNISSSYIGELNNSENIPVTLSEICLKANSSVCDEMLNVIQKRIGTTASMLCFKGGFFYLCNIGDSPIFLYRNSKLEMISKEHTEKENLILLHGVDSVPSGKKFKLTQHIGIFPEEMSIEPYIISGELRVGDRFLICSDGLTDMLKECEIAAILERRLSVGKTVKMLFDGALSNGGKDNITAILIDIKKNFFNF